MADNLNVTEGSGRTVAFHEQGGALHQLVKPGRVATNEDLVTVAYSSVTGSFASLGLANVSTSTILTLINDTDANLLFNWDNGANSDFIVLAKTERSVPILQGASQAYVKYQSAPTAGSLYCEVRK